MTTALVVAGVVLLAVVVALVAQRRRPDPPTADRHYEAPTHLDRSDFGRPDAPWLVVVFSSATCASCADAAERALVLASDAVAVVDVEVGEHPELHHRYGIEAVPITVVVDEEGEVRRSFVGPVTSTHLWGALAELRAPGSVPPGCAGGSEPDRAG